MAKNIERRGDGFLARVRRRGFPAESACFPTQAQAEAWRRQRDGELVGMRKGLAPKRTLRQALEEYTERRVDKGIGKRGKPLRGAQWERVRIKKWLGEGRSPERHTIGFLDRQLIDIHKSDLAEWRDEMFDFLEPSSVHREFSLLGSIFTACVEWGWLKASPLTSDLWPEGGKPRDRRVSNEEALAICGALGYRPGTQPETASQFTAAAFLWCIETAMRSGEALSLDQENIVDGPAALLEMTKNGDERKVPLLDGAPAMLKLLPTEGKLFRVATGTRDKLFRDAVERTGIKDLHFHDSRREATTRLAQSHFKNEPMLLSAMTGHRNLRTLMRVYYRPDMSEVARRINGSALSAI